MSINPKSFLVITGLTLFSWAIVAAIGMLLIGCGDGDYLLQEGKYNIAASVNVTTDPFITDGFDGEWKLTQKNPGRYAMTMYDTIIYGADSHGAARFTFEQKQGNDNCPFFTHLQLILFPTSYGFDGTAAMNYTFCSYYNPNEDPPVTQWVDWNTEYAVVGELQ